MHTTIIIDHPYENSFNHCLLKELVISLDKNNENYDLIDLYKDGFSPVMTTEELRTYMTELPKDSNTLRYIDSIKKQIA